MIRLLLGTVLVLLAASSCRLEQRTVPPEELPIGCQVDADCAEGRWCDRGQCEVIEETPDPDAGGDAGGDGASEGEGEGEASGVEDTIPPEETDPAAVG